MKCSQLAPLALLLAVSAPDGDLAYAPENGLAVEVQYESTVSISITDTVQRIQVDGEEHPTPDGVGHGFEMTETETIRFSEEVEMKEGHPVRIRRRFLEVGNHAVQVFTDPAGEEFESTLEGDSVFEGATVEFTWDGDEEEYSAKLDGEQEGVDEDLLAGLVARADFAGFLPEGPVAEGDEWEVPLEAYIAITYPCGDLEILQEDEEDSDEESDVYNDEFYGNLEGEITATWKETVEEDGVRHAVITVQAELTTEIVTEGEVQFGDAEGTEESTDSYEFGLEGELHWNLDAGHAISIELAGAMEMVRETTQVVDMQGSSLELAEETTFEGTVRYDVSVE